MLTIQMEKKEGLGFANVALVFFLLFFIHIHFVFAQQPGFEFKDFNPLSDITSTKASVIVEDSLGYMWIGTQEGLYRFDGQTVYSYFMDINNPKSLPSNGINNLVLDHENNLWIGTKEGICKYNREFDHFTRLPDKSEMKGFENKFVKTYTFDQTGQLFIAYNQVIYTYNQSEGQFDEVLKVDRGDISALVFDDQNNLWIGTLSNGGLFCYNLKKKQLITFQHNRLDSQSISTNEIKLLAISGQTLWIGTLGRGIDAYDLKNKTFKHYSSSKNLENYIISFLISRDKKIWACTANNLKLFDPNIDRFYDYDDDENNPFTIGKGIQSVHDDRDGNLWTISSFGGIRLARSQIPFKFIGGNSERFWATYKKELPAMVNDKRGQFWILKHSYGIDIYNWKERKTISLKHQDNNLKSIQDGIIFASYCDSKNQMWFGSYLGGGFKNTTIQPKILIPSRTIPMIHSQSPVMMSVQ